MEITRDNLIKSLRICSDPYKDCKGCIYESYKDKNICYQTLLTMSAAYMEETAKGDLVRKEESHYEV